MHFRFSLATVALLGMSASTAFGQAANNNIPPSQPPKPGPTSVALVDVGAIIKAHPTMNSEMEKIKAEMEAAHEAIESRRKSLLSESDNIVKNYDANSPDFKQKQEELLNKESKLRVDFLGQEKDFAEKQARVVFASYQDINNAINTVATTYKYDLVLRFSKEQEEMDPKKPQSVNFGLQKDVLYKTAGMDVTDYVLYVLRDQYIRKGVPISTTPAPKVATPPNSNPNGFRR